MSKGKNLTPWMQIGVKDTTTEVLCRLIEANPHQWTDQSCPTCAAITALIGRPFGCSRLQQEIAHDPG